MNRSSGFFHTAAIDSNVPPGFSFEMNKIVSYRCYRYWRIRKIYTLDTTGASEIASGVSRCYYFRRRHHVVKPSFNVSDVTSSNPRVANIRNDKV
jgi:hypothetical protein